MLITNEIAEACRAHATNNSVGSQVHEDDFIFRFLIENPVFNCKDDAVRYYFNDGAKSAGKLRKLLFEELAITPSSDATFLEFACGYGCLTRHLSKTLPEYKIISSDIHPQANQFLVDNFGASIVQSTSTPEEFPRDIAYDIIFALSFFSHMPRATWSRWLAALTDRLKPNGMLIFTTQGRGSAKYFGYPKLDETGYWFRADSEQKDLDISEYGQTIVSPGFVVAEMEKLPLAKLVLAKTEAWWEHQDLYVLQRMLAPYGASS